MSSTDDLPPPTTLSDFFKAVHDTPVTVRAVHVVGLKGTRRSLVEHAITNTLQSRTFGTLLEQSQRAGGLLTALEVAKAVHVKIDTAPQAQERKNPALAMLLGGLGGGGASAASKGSHREQKSPSSGPEEVDVILSCDSIGRIRLKTGTEVGQDEVGVNTVGTLVNMFGGGETLTGSVAYGTRTTSDYKLHYSMPIAYDPLRRFDCLLHHANTDHQLRSSYDELNRGILLKYQTYADGMLGGWLPSTTHSFSYVCDWRTVHNIKREGVGATIRHAAGHSIKSALGYEMVMDTRDSAAMPSSGSVFKLRAEYAGLGGDVQHAKVYGETQKAVKLGDAWNWFSSKFSSVSKDASDSRGFFSNLVLTKTAVGGLLLPLNASGKSFISDRFFLGGPSQIRMFHHGGIGPRDGPNAAIGGDIMLANCLSVRAPIPGLDTDKVQLHFWINNGTLASLKDAVGDGKDAGLRTTAMMDLWKKRSVSAGFGLALQWSIARLEMNVGVPVVMAETDVVNKGLFQLGVNLEMW